MFEESTIDNLKDEPTRVINLPPLEDNLKSSNKYSKSSTLSLKTLFCAKQTSTQAEMKTVAKNLANASLEKISEALCLHVGVRYLNLEGIPALCKKKSLIDFLGSFIETINQNTENSQAAAFHQLYLEAQALIRKSSIDILCNDFSTNHAFILNGHKQLIEIAAGPSKQHRHPKLVSVALLLAGVSYCKDNHLNCTQILPALTLQLTAHFDQDCSLYRKLTGSGTGMYGAYMASISTALKVQHGALSMKPTE